ncbi:phage tail sheath subtilisin-like domain-containing protein [Dyadobacter sp. CY107]|uniref:phage tail sheath family protein n=1 Tax=Dyadobacter fanqingshengii TaxID=2906443 RepID=UPI001F183ABA|nr:phage tail sheath C-terminal domain-containing protein [Dyadobacter fanqingshengii]MCF2504879.1 phage tail sheath subtilisin-like domain-containing protein [Dyadobacter fanqingshengii]
MITKLATPGVYVDEIPTLPPTVAEVDSAIPAFIGYTEKAKRFADDDLIGVPFKISGMEEYELFFGKGIEVFETLINDATKGVKLTINEVTEDPANPDTATAKFEVTMEVKDEDFPKHNLYYSLKHYFANGGGNCYVVAVDKFSDTSSPVKGKLLDGVAAVQDVDEVTIVVIPEAQWSDGYKDVYEAAVMQAEELKDRFVLIDPKQVTIPSNTSAIDGDAAAIRNDAKASSYAAAYYPNLVTTYERFSLDKVKIDAHTLNGAALPAVNPNHPDMKDKSLNDLKTIPKRGFAAYNQLIAEVSKHPKTRVVLPPSPAVAGIYARVDFQRGVWKAPANEAVMNVSGALVELSSKQQENLNIDSLAGESINVIRTFPGFGTLVWGARTLKGNDAEWRYVSVRRFMMVVEESIKKSLQWAVFEPNTASTWVRVKGLIENYLFDKWRQGALAGVKPDDAFYVKIGLGTTMTPQDVLNGIMNVEIGVAIARPAEFIVLKFIQVLQKS